jgi:hypothetical protein
MMKLTFSFLKLYYNMSKLQSLKDLSYLYIWKGPLLHQIVINIQKVYIFIKNLQYHTISLKFVQNL